jgi:hypothetical protein
VLRHMAPPFNRMPSVCWRPTGALALAETSAVVIDMLKRPSKHAAYQRNFLHGNAWCNARPTNAPASLPSWSG